MNPPKCDKRVCQCCKQHMPSNRGGYVRQRWVCSDCLAKEKGHTAAPPKKSAPGLHPMFALMLGYAAPPAVTLPPSCTRTHVMDDDDEVSIYVSQDVLDRVMLELTHPEMTATEISEASNIRVNTVNRALRSLMQVGKVRIVRLAKWRGNLWEKLEEETA